MMLFHLRLKNIGVKIFESIVLLKNARYSRGPSLNHEKQLFTSRKYLFQVEKYKKLEGCRCYKKTHHFQNIPHILLRAFLKLPKIFFSDLASKSESRKIVKSAPDFDIFSWWRYESRRAQRA
jgi:hypothetical protein